MNLNYDTRLQKQKWWHCDRRWIPILSLIVSIVSMLWSSATISTGRHSIWINLQNWSETYWIVPGKRQWHFQKILKPWNCTWPEKIRHPDSFTSSITLDPGILDEDYKVPPLIIQPYVENAILHGLIHKQDKSGKIDIHISRIDDHLVYRVEDNGVGRKITNGDMKRNDKGYGMQISKDRIRLFNDEEVASVQITDLISNGLPSGTRITVHLKTS